MWPPRPHSSASTAGAIVSLLLALLSSAGAFAQDAIPRVPPARDPGGVAIALLSTGVDYTLPAIAARLARDGEGEIIAWDFERNDRHPFDRSKGSTPAEWGGDATAIASAILKDTSARLVIARIVPGDPVSLKRAVAFIFQTSARVVIVPMRTSRREQWEPFAQAATSAKDMLFIVPAGDTAESGYPAALKLENAVVVPANPSDAASIGFGGATQRLLGSHVALVAAAQIAATALARNPKLGIAELRRLVTEK